MQVRSANPERRAEPPTRRFPRRAPIGDALRAGVASVPWPKTRSRSLGGESGIGRSGNGREVIADEAARRARFYTTIAPHAGLRIGVDEPDHVRVVGENFSFSLIGDERPLTEHVHLAFPAQGDATVRAF